MKKLLTISALAFLLLTTGVHAAHLKSVTVKLDGCTCDPTTLSATVNIPEKKTPQSLKIRFDEDTQLYTITPPDDRKLAENILINLQGSGFPNTNFCIHSGSTCNETCLAPMSNCPSCHYSSIQARFTGTDPQPVKITCN